MNTDNFNRIAQTALSDLVAMIPEASRANAQKEIDTLYTALVMLDYNERMVRAINSTLHHHGNERQQLLDRLAG